LRTRLPSISAPAAGRDRLPAWARSSSARPVHVRAVLGLVLDRVIDAAHVIGRVQPLPGIRFVSMDGLCRKRRVGVSAAPPRSPAAQQTARVRPLTSRATTTTWRLPVLALDPRSVEARSLLADALASRVKAGMTDSATTDIARAEALVGQALAASSRSATVHFAKRNRLWKILRSYFDVVRHSHRSSECAHRCAGST
jgi:hypothetical protein